MPAVSHITPAAIETAKTFLRKAEATRLQVYCCPAGVPTIGVGHTGADVFLGMPPITVSRAEELLDSDVRQFAAMIDAAVIVPLTPNQMAALILILFNTGPGIPGRRDGIIKLKGGGPSSLLRLLNAGRYAEYDAKGNLIGGAAAQFLRWNNAIDPKTGRLGPLEGLTIRKQAEMELFLRP